MVTILKYIFLGLLLYIFIIPILEQIASILCQWLENQKGKLVYKQTILQQKIDNANTKSTNSNVNAIGFSIPIDEIEIEEKDDEE